MARRDDTQLTLCKLTQIALCRLLSLIRTYVNRQFFLTIQDSVNKSVYSTHKFFRFRDIDI